MNLKEYAAQQEEAQNCIAWLKDEIRGEEEVIQGLKEALAEQEKRLLQLQAEADFIRNQKEY